MTRILSKSPPPIEIGTSKWTEPFWNAAREYRLVAACCGTCGRFRMPPTPFCPHCRSQEIDWIELSGRGIVYSWTVVVKPMLPGMDDRVPYVPAVIELPDAAGVRLVSNIVDADLEQISIGQEVKVKWETWPDGTVVPMFEITGSET
jgi:uncharacterized OB-fold protein